jgi:hypothetical protein
LGYPIASRCGSPVAQFTTFSFSFADFVAGWTVTENRGQGYCFWLQYHHIELLDFGSLVSPAVWCVYLPLTAVRNQYFDSIVSHARVINELGVGVSFLESVQGSFAEEGAARGCTTLIGVEAVSTNCINVALGERFEHERIEDLNAPSIRSWAISELQ